MTYINNPNRTMSEPGKELHEAFLRMRRVNPCQKEHSRLLTAAVVNDRFRKLLLNNPAQALASGYCGEIFHFPPEEKQRVTAIQASSLSDFAEQLIEHRTPVHHYLNCP
ncbi:MAG: hypothetical protein K8R77_06545 [Anaerolineaceae bacterium]|nr:hypothetical protein [Anaerolineaceae bacterium]